MCCSHQKSPPISTSNEKISSNFLFFFFLIELLGHYTPRSLHRRVKRPTLPSLLGDSAQDGTQRDAKSSFLVLCLLFKDLKIVFSQEKINIALFPICKYQHGAYKQANASLCRHLTTTVFSEGHKKCRLRCQNLTQNTKPLVYRWSYLWKSQTLNKQKQKMGNQSVSKLIYKQVRHFLTYRK